MHHYLFVVNNNNFPFPHFYSELNQYLNSRKEIKIDRKFLPIISLSLSAASTMFYARTAAFRDRQEAGQKLAEALAQFKSQRENVVVLALPRGGVPVAFEVAKALQAPLDLLMVRKIGAPGHEEYGIGAVVEGDPPQLVLNDEAVRITRPPEGYVQAAMNKQLKEIDRQRNTYLGGRKPFPLAGKIAIVVDDGIATGGTARVAMKALRQKNVARAILASPVSPADTMEELRAEGNEVLVLQTPPNFSAVGLHYGRFDQTSDDEVIRCLEESSKWLPSGDNQRN